MEVNSNTVGDVVVFKLVGELTNRNELATHFWSHLHKGNSKFVINCTQLRLINSAGLSALIEFNRLAEASGGAIVLFGMSAEVLKMFKSTRLDEIFTISDDEELALSSLIQGLPVLDSNSTVSRYRN